MHRSHTDSPVFEKSKRKLNPRMMQKIRLPALLLILVISVAYLPTLQTIPNGSSHIYVVDVGETQIVLNNWGTLHATGYPLFVMSGNLLTETFTAFGMSNITAAAVVSLVWTWALLLLLFVLCYHLTGQAWIAAGVTVLFGLTRSVWIHAVTAEVYSFGLMLQILLWVIALWRPPINGRIYWLAFIGGVALAHHRSTLVMIPGLVMVVWPYLWEQRRKLPRLVAVSLMLGLAGFVQYVYLYIRGLSGDDWVYGEPGTLSGLRDQFLGEEAAGRIGMPGTWDELISNWGAVNAVLIEDLSVPGVVVGVIGLALAVWNPRFRPAAIPLAIVAGFSYVFHVGLIHTDVLSGFMLLVMVSLVIGWAFLAHEALNLTQMRYRHGLVTGAGALMAVWLVAFNWPFVNELVNDEAGLQAIEQIRPAPEGATVMLAWGPLYFAGAIAQILQDDLTHITLVDDKVDFRTITGQLVTPEYTLFTQTLDWWRERLGWDAVYVEAIAPRLVTLFPEPRIATQSTDTIMPVKATILCGNRGVALDVLWQMSNPSVDEDLSIFVHGLSADGDLIAQGDQSAPVYGWRPFSRWLADEQVSDIYPIEGADDVHTVRYGLYRVTLAGEFENVSIYDEIPVDC